MIEKGWMPGRCKFRSKVRIDSSAKRAVIPLESAHGFLR
jgi:hypothetical protein